MKLNILLLGIKYQILECSYILWLSDKDSAFLYAIFLNWPYNIVSKGFKSPTFYSMIWEKHINSEKSYSANQAPWVGWGKEKSLDL